MLSLFFIIKNIHKSQDYIFYSLKCLNFAVNNPKNVTFSDLNLSTPLLNALNDIGFSKPTTIQHKAFPVIMSGKDVVGLAQTGTGKTLAYLLPLLRLMKFSKSLAPKILIVVPTRELVMQVVEEVEKLTTYMTIRVGGVYGGTNMNTQKKIVLEGLDILIATPGRLMDLALNGYLNLKEVKHLVIDEIDEMLNLGFRTQLHNILDLLPPKRQNLLFSATMTEEVENLIAEFTNGPQKIEAAAIGTPLEKIIQSGYKVPNFYTKVNLLSSLLDSDTSMSKVLVFVATKKLSDLLFEKLSEIYPDQMGVIHSNKSQNFRFNSLINFQNGSFRVLIATDLVARGLDLTDVTHVVNFDIPDDSLLYIHRIGRTGRADKDGIALSFIAPYEEDFLKEIEGLMKMNLTIIPTPENLEISSILIEEEKPVIKMPEQNFKITKSVGGAFHEKSDLNKKVNLGGSYRRMIKIKYKKPKTRGQKKK